MTDLTAQSILKRPLAAPAGAFALGIIGSEYARLSPAIAVLAVLGTLALMLLWRSRPHTFPAFIAAGAFFTGAAVYGVYTTIDPLDVSHCAGPGFSTVSGVVTSDPDVSERRVRIFVQADGVLRNGAWRRAAGNIVVFAYAQKDRTALPKYGDRVLASGRISSPPEPSNPGEFSYKTYLARQRIYCVLHAWNPRQLRVTGGGERNSFVVFAGRIRDSIKNSIGSQMSEPCAGIAAGMALGTYSTLPDDVFSDFSRTGTLHLLAASGFNCAVIVGLVLLIFRATHLPRRWAYAAAIPLLILYMLIVGPQPSIVRATIMASLFAGGYIWGRMSDTLNILLAAALVILAIRPTDLFDVGFQLSFAAVLAIIIVVPLVHPFAERIFGRIGPQPPRHPDRFTARLGQNLADALAATIAACVGTTPIIAQYFNQFSLVSIPVNAAVALLAPPIFVISLFAPVLAAVPGLGSLAANFDSALISLMLVIVDAFGSQSWSCVAVRSPGVLTSTGYYLIAGTALVYLSRKPRRLQ